jgi:predicted DNA-binding ribbon-helix-helix protein
MKSVISKRSIFINKHKTSISLEDDFWQAIKEIAGLRKVPVAELIGEIDELREQGNLSSAVRLFVLSYYQDRQQTNPME